MVTIINSTPKVEGSIGLVVSVVTQSEPAEPANREYIRKDFVRDLEKASRSVRPSRARPAKAS